MSSDFRQRLHILARDLFDGRLAKFGILECVTPQEDQAPNDDQLVLWVDDVWELLTLQDDHNRTLVDALGNCVWVYIDDHGSVVEFTSYGCNDPDAILAAVAEAFETEIFSEHEPQFWGFETFEELYEDIEDGRKAQPLTG